MDNFKMKKIRESKELNLNSLDYIRGGVDSTNCSKNSCNVNSGACSKENYCADNSGACVVNECSTNHPPSIGGCTKLTIIQCPGNCSNNCSLLSKP